MVQIRKILIGVFFLFLFLIPDLAAAQEKVSIYFFESDVCPHCAKEKAFLEKLTQEIPQIEVKDFVISEKTPENIKLLQRIGQELNIDVSYIPITIIGNKYFTGYADDENSGQLIKNLINQYLVSGYEDLLVPVVREIEQDNENEIRQEIPQKINVPFFNEIEIKNFSLPILTVVLAGIDGFNPCAMWVLIFLISLLLGMENKKRMWLLGITFIAFSALVYFLFLSAWLNLFLFLGFIFWVRLAVGLAALFSGFYYLRKYFTDKINVCQVSQGEKQQKIFEKLKNITQKKQLWLALIGIVLLAGTVNLVELICSAGLPAIYTNILSLSELSASYYYLYLVLYIFIFMLDDMIVFAVAMITLRTVGLTKKYSRFSALVGGILIFIIGLLLIFKPEWLMFG